jgi:coatomer protein complex subunit alpha (xenin)
MGGKYTLWGHVNMSCVIFHAQQDIIVSNYEGKIICIWDISKHIVVQTFHMKHDHFWILATYLEMSVLATRHDSGIIMFKLKRERLAFVMQGGILYYIKEQHLHPYDFSTQKDNLLISIHNVKTITQKDNLLISIHNVKTITMNQTPRSLSCS